MDNQELKVGDKVIPINLTTHSMWNGHVVTISGFSDYNCNILIIKEFLEDRTSPSVACHKTRVKKAFTLPENLFEIE